MSLWELIVEKWYKYWMDDEKREDFLFRRRILIGFCIIGSLAAMNEIYQGILKVR